MSPIACNCGKNAQAQSYTVKVPGQAERTVQSEAAAITLVRGIRGASYRANPK